MENIQQEKKLTKKQSQRERR